MKEEGGERAADAVKSNEHKVEIQKITRMTRTCRGIFKVNEDRDANHVCRQRVQLEKENSF